MDRHTSARVVVRHRAGGGQRPCELPDRRARSRRQLDGTDVREVELHLQRHVDLQALGGPPFTITTRSCMPTLTNRLRAIEIASRGRPFAVSFRIERGPEVLDGARPEEQRRSASHSQDQSREEAPVMRRNHSSPWRCRRGRPRCRRSSLRGSSANRYASLRRMRPPLDWARALITISSMFTWSGLVSAKRTTRRRRPQ